MAALVATSNPRQAPAFGPSKVLLQKPTYREVVCPPKTQVPGQKAGAGLRPVCIVVSVDAENISKEPLQDAGVFGFVYDEQGESVVANNPDGRVQHSRGLEHCKLQLIRVALDREYGCGAICNYPLHPAGQE